MPELEFGITLEGSSWWFIVKLHSSFLSPFSGHLALPWTPNSSLDTWLFPGHLTIPWTPSSSLDTLLFPGQWTPYSSLDTLLFPGHLTLPWTPCSSLDTLLFPGHLTPLHNISMKTLSLLGHLFFHRYLTFRKRASPMLWSRSFFGQLRLRAVAPAPGSVTGSRCKVAIVLNL